jgi:hypothetical protein|tara:strand:+ start:170 stop:424 length:255 start_codon:yes stop_codon:yes gene_type:complete
LKEGEKMAINDDITVKVGKAPLPVIEVPTTTTIKHATTGKVYADEKEAKADINNPATSTKDEDIQRDVSINIKALPGILGETLK